ncbi:DUF2254 domain-containing protein [Lysobacter sp. A3-1-A15]|uniref:DUF2254 domain-containing protein n=1 Tax=Novilysobacter viscosus TaxID=3098602 RepID=UPI002EDB183C
MSSDSGITTRLQWLWLQARRRLWFRASAFSALAVATALVAIVAERYIPWELSDQIGAEAVSSLLNIIAASMLSVTIFSLSTLVAALSSATSNVTPRATRLLAEDRRAQNALSTFIGSFLFSLVGIIGVHAGLYGQRGRVVLYVVTLFVIAGIVATLLRWIDHVSRLGRVGETADRVEDTATRALSDRHSRPFLGGRPFPEPLEPPPGARPVPAERFGYVQHLDMRALQDWAEEADARVLVASPPGTYVDTRWPLAWIEGGVGQEGLEDVRDAFSVGDMRSFDQDPRFGLSVLTEIASRALSPAVNDPGTAIDILGRATRALATWAAPTPAEAQETPYPNVAVPGIRVDDLFEDVFLPIGRDGAALVEVAVRVQKSLASLAGTGDERYQAAAARQSTMALARAELALALEHDLSRVRDAAARVQALASGADPFNQPVA